MYRDSTFRNMIMALNINIIIIEIIDSRQKLP